MSDRTLVICSTAAGVGTVQTLMGHASPTPIARYNRRGDAVRRAAAQRLNFL